MKKSDKILLSYEIAFLFLGGFTAVCARIVPDTDVLPFEWYIVFAALCLMLYVVERQLSRLPEKTHIKMLFFSIVLGGILFISDVLFAYSDHPDFAFGKLAHIAVRSGGFVETVIVCPVMSIILVAGFVRRRFLRLLNSGAE